MAQIIDERRDSSRERRRYIRAQQRRERSKGKIDLCNMSPITYLLAAILWLTVIIEALAELSR